MKSSELEVLVHLKDCNCISTRWFGDAFFCGVSIQCLAGSCSIPLKSQFHVKSQRKKVSVEKWIFVDEMWKIIGQSDDFGRFLNNFGNFGVFLAKNRKYPKITVLKKWKKKKKKKKKKHFFFRLNNLFQIIYISF